MAKINYLPSDVFGYRMYELHAVWRMLLPIAVSVQWLHLQLLFLLCYYAAFANQKTWLKGNRTAFAASAKFYKIIKHAPTCKAPHNRQELFGFFS